MKTQRVDKTRPLLAPAACSSRRRRLCADQAFPRIICHQKRCGKPHDQLKRPADQKLAIDNA